MICKFSDPHPGYGGAISPLPKIFLNYCNYIDGKEIDINTVIGEFKNISKSFPDSHIEVSNNNIYLRIGNFKNNNINKPIHSWRLIRYKKGQNAL